MTLKVSLFLKTSNARLTSRIALWNKKLSEYVKVQFCTLTKVVGKFHCEAALLIS